MKIAQLLQSDYWGEVGPEALERGIGGREGAMIRLAREWSKSGHEVTNFVAVKESKRHYEGDGFHEYVPFNLALSALKTWPYDAVVSWEFPGIFNDSRVQEMQRAKFVEMQVAHPLAGSEKDFPFADRVCVLSSWAGRFLRECAPQIDPEKITVLPNGVDLKNYPKEVALNGEKRRTGPKKFHYSSSPDRGLLHLLRMWKDIRAEYPDAILRVGYGVTRWSSQLKWSHNAQGEMALEIEELMHQPGIDDVGTIGQSVLAEYQKESVAWLYPCDPMQPTETGCISAIESGAAGAPIFTTNADCLEEEFGGAGSITDLPLDYSEYLSRVFGVIESKDEYAEMQAKGRELAEGRQWKDISGQWLRMFQEVGQA